MAQGFSSSHAVPPHLCNSHNTVNPNPAKGSSASAAVPSGDRSLLPAPAVQLAMCTPADPPVQPLQPSQADKLLTLLMLTSDTPWFLREGIW